MNEQYGKPRRFRPNRKFQKKYNCLFHKDPVAANLFLLLAEIANENGQVVTDPQELSRLMAARFKDPEALQI